MKTNLAKQIAAKAKTLEAELSLLPGLLRKIHDSSGKAFPLSANIPERDEPLVSLINRARDVARIGMPSHLGSVSATIADGQLHVLNQKFDEMLSVVREMTSFARNNSQIGSIDSNFILVDKNGNTFDLRSLVFRLYDRIEEILNLNTASYLFRRSRDKDALSEDTAQIVEALQATSKQYEDAKNRLSEIENTAREYQTEFEQIRAKNAEASRLLEQGSLDRRTVQDYLGQVTAAAGSVKQTTEEAAALSSGIKSYRSKFDQFDKQLDQREQKLKEGDTHLDWLLQGLRVNESEIESLIKRGEEMLSLTTTAGLSSNYLNTVNNLTKELQWARRAFYFGIGVLFVSALPLFANAIIPLLVAFYPPLQHYQDLIGHPSAQEPWQYIAQVFARLIVLVPAAWLVSFSAKRHSSLFKLREHYAYKYSLAASVEGFKKEAEKYGDEIAATVFSELSFNPAERLDQQDLEVHKAPNPFLQKLLDLIQSGGHGSAASS